MTKSGKHTFSQNNTNKVGKTSNLFHRVSELIEQSRQEIVTKANAILLITNYEIGRYIVEDEQQGENRAEYGKKVLQELSQLLTKQYGRGWSVRNLRSFRHFYLTYSNSLNVFSKSDLNSANASAKSDLNSVNVFTKFKNTKLSWSHYLILMRIEKPEERNFYEIESIAK